MKCFRRVRVFCTHSGQRGHGGGTPGYGQRPTRSRQLKINTVGNGNKKITAILQNCYKNFNKSSTAIEVEIIVEGFKISIEMHYIKYTKIVGDVDSSVIKKLYETSPQSATPITKN